MLKMEIRIKKKAHADDAMARVLQGDWTAGMAKKKDLTIDKNND